MKFGTQVIVERGGHRPTPGTPGCKRFVKGKLVWARGHDRWVKLLEDDPYDTVGWNKAGMIGRWSAGAVIEAGAVTEDRT